MPLSREFVIDYMKKEAKACAYGRPTLADALTEAVRLLAEGTTPPTCSHCESAESDRAALRARVEELEKPCYCCREEACCDGCRCSCEVSR